MIKLRLKKYGRKGQISYRIVAMTSSTKRDVRAIEELVFYNPRTKEVNLNLYRINIRLNQGAQPTPTVENLLKISYKHDFNVYHGVIVAENKNLECKLTHGNYFACENVDYKVKNNITFNELQEKYNIIFDTLVIDCEGCYEDLFSDGFEKGWFDNIKKIIIEWDGRDFEKVILDKGFYFISYLPHVNLEKGVRVYFR